MFLVASMLFLFPGSAYSDDECKNSMPKGYTVSEIAQLRENIRAAGGLSGIEFPSQILFGNPMFYLFLGYASADSGDEFLALAYFENAEFYAFERNYCNKKIVRELSSIGRYHVITRFEKKLSNNNAFQNWTFGLTFSPKGVNIQTFKIANCVLFSSDIGTVMSDTDYERIYSTRECY